MYHNYVLSTNKSIVLLTRLVDRSYNDLHYHRMCDTNKNPVINFHQHHIEANLVPSDAQFIGELSICLYSDGKRQIRNNDIVALNLINLYGVDHKLMFESS